METIEQHDEETQRLIRDAAIAAEIFGDDVLERFVEELRQLSQNPGVLTNGD